MTSSRKNPVIASPTQSGVAIQSLDKLRTLSASKRLDCFVSRHGGILAMTTGGKP